MNGPVRAGVAAVTVLLVVAGGALAAPPRGSSVLDRRIYYAEQAIDNASRQVERDHACRPRAPERGPVDGSPSATFLDSIAALRRPAQPGEDLALMRPHAQPFAELSVYRDYVRVVTAPGGS